MISKEHIVRKAEVIIPAVFASSLLFLAANFDRSTKEQIFHKQHGSCAHPGCTKKAIQVHHRVPKSLGGSAHFHNGVGLCRKHHQHWDRLAFEGIVFPGIPKENAPDTCFVESAPSKNKRAKKSEKNK
jgi:hypothetical protein